MFYGVDSVPIWKLGPTHTCPRVPSVRQTCALY